MLRPSEKNNLAVFEFEIRQIKTHAKFSRYTVYTLTHSFVFKALPNFWIHGLIDFLVVGQTGLPSSRGGCLKTTEEQSPRGSREERHLKVLGDGVVWGELTGREHVLCMCGGGG